MFVKTKTKVVRVHSEWCSVISLHFSKLLFETNNERNSVLEELKVRRFADIQEEICCRAVWRWAILESK